MKSWCWNKKSNENLISLVALEKPHNPLINAGALITTSFLLTLMRREMAISEKFEFVKDFIKVKTNKQKNQDKRHTRFPILHNTL